MATVKLVRGYLFVAARLTPRGQINKIKRPAELNSNTMFCVSTGCRPFVILTYFQNQRKENQKARLKFKRAYFREIYAMFLS